MDSGALFIYFFGLLSHSDLCNFYYSVFKFTYSFLCSLTPAPYSSVENVHLAFVSVILFFNSKIFIWYSFISLVSLGRFYTFSFILIIFIMFTEAFYDSYINIFVI